jgi:hypothetical protein
MEMHYLGVPNCQTFDTIPSGTRFRILTTYHPRGVVRLLAPLLKRQQERHLAEEAENLERALEDADLNAQVTHQSG